MDVSFFGFSGEIGRHTHSSERGYLDECETDDTSHNGAITQHRWGINNLTYNIRRTYIGRYSIHTSIQHTYNISKYVHVHVYSTYIHK